ncbi:MAG: purine-nucleoside phosphorylase [Anaerolineae bacterium]
MARHITYEALQEATEAVRARIQQVPAVGLVLGSGLGATADLLQAPDVVPFGDIPHLPRSTVTGHEGKLLVGSLAGVPTCVLQGRIHYYEGHSAARITFPIRLMRELGVHTVVVTNAAGGLRVGLRPGDLMAIVDHINLPGLAGHNPLRGANDDRIGPRFPSMTRAYDPGLRALLAEEAGRRGIPLQQGVYAMVAGPSFETPAEVRFLRAIGADAVGMSTVPEVIVARHGGMRVLGISLISNVAIDSLDGLVAEPTHQEVLQAGREAGDHLAALLEGIIPRLA